MISKVADFSSVGSQIIGGTSPGVAPATDHHFTHEFHVAERPAKGSIRRQNKTVILNSVLVHRFRQLVCVKVLVPQLF